MIFKASPPNSADASRTGCTAGHRCTCSEAGAEQQRWGPAGPGLAVVFPLLRAAKVLLFFPAVGEKKAGRQLLLQDWGQQELCWPPRDLKPFREGMQRVLAMFLCKQLQILGFPPPKIKFLPASVPSGKEREAEMTPVGVGGQISPNGILGSEDANPLPITTGSFLLSVTCWCRVLNFSIS